MRKLLKFSAIMRIITIIALAAVIGFSMIACPDDGGDPPPPEDPTPVSADYDFGNLWQAEGSVAAVIIVPKQGKSSGAITIYYEGAGDTTYAKSGTLPTRSSVIGKYRVTFDVAAATGWKAANGLSAGLLIIFPIPNVPPPSNSLENPYTIKLNISDDEFVEFLGTTLQSMEGIYIKLDFSDSAITTIPNSVFNTIDENSPEECKWTGNANLIHVILPDTVTTIEGNAFSKCTNLTSIDMGGVIEIKPWAFEYSGLIIVNIPNSVTIIGDGAFNHLENLEMVNIGSGVIEMGEYVFGRNDKLAEINVDNSNTVFSSHEGVLFNKNKTNIIQCPWAKTGDFTIPNSVTSIGEGAFYNCSFVNITIPSSVISIENYAFQRCENLESLTFTPTSEVTNIGMYAFQDTKLANVTIPASVTSIGEGAFNNCTDLTSVEFEGTISSSGFSENWVFPGNLRYAFYAYPNETSGTPGTYIRGEKTVEPWGDWYEWEKQP